MLIDNSGLNRSGLLFGLVRNSEQRLMSMIGLQLFCAVVVTAFCVLMIRTVSFHWWCIPFSLSWYLMVLTTQICH